MTNEAATEEPTLEEVLSTWLTTGPAAELAGVGDRWLVKLAEKGKVRHVKTAIGRFYQPESLRAYAALPKGRWLHKTTKATAAKKEPEAQQDGEQAPPAIRTRQRKEVR